MRRYWMNNYIRNNQHERKIISVSKKRQITIPKKYFIILGFSNEVECILQENSIVIRPIRENVSDEFGEFILSELIEQGYSGQELITKFKETRRKIRPAVEDLLSEAEEVAKGKKKGSTLEDVFKQEDR